MAGLGYQGENAGAGSGRRCPATNWAAFPEWQRAGGASQRALRAMVSDGFFDEVNPRYFGPEFTITYEDLE